MTDVFISGVRDDLQRIRPLIGALEAEGWDVRWGADDPEGAERDIGLAAVVLVVWSAAARGSDGVRAEAAAGMYRNRLVQVRLDGAAAPRPFDQLEVMDVGGWTGDREDATWRAVLAAARLKVGGAALRRSVGPAGGTVMRRPAQRSAAGPVIGAAAALVLAVGAAGALVFGNPLNLRLAPAADSGAATAAAAAAATAAAAEAAPPAAALQASAAADAAWAQVDRDDPSALRAFITQQPGTTAAEFARSALRVLDAQAWAQAVIADTEGAYSIYLAGYPAEATPPGAMAAGAKERLASLGAERAAAIADVQRSLIALGVYQGAATGRLDSDTSGAVKTFAASVKRQAPELGQAAPRDLRSFGDLVRAEALKINPAAIAAPTATETAASAVAPGASAEALTQAQAQALAAAAAAEAADRLRLEQAEAGRLAAERGAEALAAAELARAQDAAWTQATTAGDVAGYQQYLAAWPGSARAADAQALIADLSRAPPFSVDRLDPDVRAAVQAARLAKTAADARAADARAAAAAADEIASAARTGQPGATTIIATDGDRFEAQVADGAPNGFGVRISGDRVSEGDRYRGELRGGLSVGLGVYEFAQNPNNAEAGALRYEGEHARDQAAGLGVTHWRNGDSYGGETSVGPDGSGVLNFADGQRYEGEVANGARNGLGVVWSSTGELVSAGRWVNGELVE